jgi:lipopolysaccharide exporter
MTAQKPKSITTRLIAGAGWNLAWRMISRTLGFVSILILAQLLVPADIGIVAIATSISGAIDALSQLQVRDALVRLPDHRAELYDTAFTIQVGRGLITGLLLAVLSIFSGTMLGDDRVKAVLLVMAGIAILGGGENIGLVALTRELNFRVQFFMQAAPRLIGFIVTTVLAFLLRSYWALVFGMIVAKVTYIGLTYLASPHRPRFSFAGWRYLLHFSFWSWLVAIALAVWSRCDPFLIGPVVGTSLLGIYMIAAEIAYLPLSELLEPACATLFPGFALAHREGTAPIAMGLTVAAVLALGTVPFALALSACSGFIVTGLLGEKWEAAQPVIAIMTWVCVFSPFSYVGATALSAQGQVRQVAISSGIAALLKVLVLLIARQSHELTVIAGATVGTVGTESFIFIYQLRAAGNSELRQLAMTTIRVGFAAAASAGILYLIPGTWSIVHMNRVEALIVGGLIGVVTFALFGFILVALWLFAGKPAGAENRAIQIIRDRAPDFSLRPFRLR